MKDYASVSAIWSGVPWRVVQYSACEMFTNKEGRKPSVSVSSGVGSGWEVS